MEKITENTLVSLEEIALVLDVTPRWIQQLAAKEIIPKSGRGSYPLVQCIRQYVEYRVSNLSEPTEEDIRIECRKKKADANYKNAKARIAEIEAAELEGIMHRSEDVAAMTEDLIYTIRGALLALPGRMAIDAAAAQTAAEASDLIRREVHKIMRQLAAYRYDPEKYEERVRERMNWEKENRLDDMPDSL